MNHSAEILSRLLKQALWHDAGSGDAEWFGGVTDSEWTDVQDLALRQNVAAIAFDALTELGIALPRAIKMRFISDTDRIESEYAAKLAAAVRLAGIFRRRGIGTMILKGLGLSLLYPKPNHRACCDIDIYLFGRQREGDEIMRREYGVAVDEGKHHHTVFHFGGTAVENHYDFIETHSRPSRSKLERRLKVMARAEQPMQIDLGDGVQIFIPSPNLNALFLTIHSGSHFAASNISIKHLADWSLFVAHYGGQVDWERFYATADEFGFRRYAEILNAMCIEYIGLQPIPQLAVAQDSDTVARSLADVMEYGKRAIPSGFIKGWRYRIARRVANTWKQRMVFRDGAVSSFIMSVATHLIKPKYWRRDESGQTFE